MLEQQKEYQNIEQVAQPEQPPVSENNFLDEAVFQNLPPILHRACNVFSDTIEKNLGLLGSLVVLSGCLPNVYGVYDRDKIGANLFLFIVAPASSGKGSLKWAKYLGQSIHNTKREEYKKNLQKYREDIAAKKKDGEVPEHPKQLLHYIPANSSASAFIQALTNSAGRGTLFCTEADTLSNSFGQDWGNYSDIIRCAFHHELINMLRISNDDYKEIEKPYVSILLSGTPGQVHKLIPSPENGLMSRFCFFSFQSKPTMKDVFANDGTDFEAHFQQLGQQVEKLHDYLNNSLDPIRFVFTDEQKADFLKFFGEGHAEFHIALGLDGIPSIRRLAVIMFRIAMILSVCRLNTEAPRPDKITCSDQDYQTAKMILKTLKEHTIKVFEKVDKSSHKKTDLSRDKYKLYKALPDTEFTRKEAVEICKKLKLSESTTDRLLKSEYFEKPAYGKYRKVN